MVQEKKMEPRLGPLDVVLYAAILCIHYPLRVALATFRLTKATIVKAVSLPRQFLGSAIPLLTAIEQTLEKKIIGILNLLATLPSYIFGKTKSSINLESKQEQIVNDPKEIGEKRKSYLEIILALQAKLSDIVYDSIVTVVTIWGHFILLPLKLILFPLKVGKSVIGTLLNFPAPKDPMMEKNINKSIFERLFDLIYIILREVQFYLIFIITMIEKLVYQLTELIRSTPRHLFNAIKQFYIRCMQALVLTLIFTYNLARYSLFYIIYFVNILIQKVKKNQPVKEPAVVQSKASTVNASSDKDIQKLIQENSKLKNALVRAQEKNENHKCDQQIKDLEIQLKDVQLAFDKERQQYKRDITKLKQELNQNNTEKISDFNSERIHLQSEIQKLQNLIAEVQKDNEEESRIKKQEAIDLDNERNQLQEQIQTLQLEVVGLQKQSEANALSYSEANKQMERNFEAEREQLHREIQELKNKITEIEDSQNEGKNHQVNDEGEELSMKNNIDSVNKTKKKRVTSAY